MAGSRVCARAPGGLLPRCSIWGLSFRGLFLDSIEEGPWYFRNLPRPFGARPVLRAGFFQPGAHTVRQPWSEDWAAGVWLCLMGRRGTDTTMYAGPSLLLGALEGAAIFQIFRVFSLTGEDNEP